jgi:pimeloyl-ACP methyl ester carboxylesterase
MELATAFLNNKFALTNDDAFKSMTEICNENGFLSENYQITTEDHYILDLYRIPGKISEAESTDLIKPAVLMMHC